MPFNKSKYNNDFSKQTYDRISVLVPKGTRQRWNDHATDRKESLNAFIRRAVEQCIIDDDLGRNQ
ncbi:MAG: hypothetical protein IKU30_04875 [Clostridia bacterium]|nr:hypothetical protein [Clostridia bacterium]